ncbi:LPS export ABC transporter periplasmic protein LptC [Ponticaulis sp.]|uniref:LPS export ABC transporter periplasmic protein LptC n=1 Tax=Ponticaulis sp. TaxID=2020902 RepID=UPI0025EC3ECE|nr:LPS export ABC transporter periplasmic protein LptC [Ponticaulis sp.]
MKLVFPAIALAIVGVTFAWPQLLTDQRKFRVGEASMVGVNVDGLVMKNPRYVGVDERRRPYQIAAVSASQRSKSDQLIDLVQPKADILLSDRGWVAMKARTGVFDKRTETVNLDGGVTLFYDEGYQFVSERALVDLRDGTARGDHPVVGHGEGGEIQAEGFLLYDRGTRILFRGRSKAILRGVRRVRS